MQGTLHMLILKTFALEPMQLRHQRAAREISMAAYVPAHRRMHIAPIAALRTK